ncbi:MAG: methionyl-tRNA formyltransferase [Thermodesulfovibrionales bacterium]|nr:methionyl-tRNA formyltransferase [Thermodesulfovibrionales bacterium]
MALIFFGTPYFAVPSLKTLIDEKEEISLVVTQPDRAKGRGHIISAPPVKGIALSNNIEVAQPFSIRDKDFYRKLTDISPEFIIVVAYGKILPKEILLIPKYGCINVHASLLPKYRGAAPIQWALINGEKTTGVTTMLMDKGLDTGDIFLQAELQIQIDDNIDTLSEKLSELGAKTLIKTINGIRTGSIKATPQTDEASYAPPLKKDDGRIQWNRTSDGLFNFIRGMHSWPSAYCYLNEERIKIIRVRRQKTEDRGQRKAVPGRVVKASHGELIVETGNGFLSIEELQPEGRKVMSAAAFIAGRKLKEGYEKFD